MIKLCKLDINNLIINYLSDEGYSHTLFTFKNEIKSIENVNFTFKLKDIIAKGLQFIYLEKHIKNGKFYECRSEFTLNSEHFCILNDDFSSDYEDAITNFNKTKAQVDCNKEKLFFENHESKEKEFLSLENEFTENVNELEAGKNECENSNKNNCKNSNLFANEEDIKKNAEKNEENLCFSKELNELALEKQKIDFNKLNKKKNYTKSQITQNLSVGNSQKRLKKSIREKKIKNNETDDNTRILSEKKDNENLNNDEEQSNLFDDLKNKNTENVEVLQKVENENSNSKVISDIKNPTSEVAEKNFSEKTTEIFAKESNENTDFKSSQEKIAENTHKKQPQILKKQRASKVKNIPEADNLHSESEKKAEKRGKKKVLESVDKTTIELSEKTENEIFFIQSNQATSNSNVGIEESKNSSAENSTFQNKSNETQKPVYENATVQNTIKQDIVDDNKHETKEITEANVDDSKLNRDLLNKSKIDNDKENHSNVNISPIAQNKAANTVEIHKKSSCFKDISNDISLLSWNKNKLALAGTDGTIRVYQDNILSVHTKIGQEITALTWGLNDELCLGTFKGDVIKIGEMGRSQPIAHANHIGPIFSIKVNQYLSDSKANNTINDVNLDANSILNLNFNSNTAIQNGITENNDVHSTNSLEESPIMESSQHLDTLLAVSFDGNASVIKKTASLIKIHSRPILDCDWVSETKFVTCSTDFDVALIDYRTNDIRLLKGHIDNVNSVSHNKNIIASTSDDNLVILWNINDEKNANLVGHKKGVLCQCWLDKNSNPASAQKLATSGNDGNIIIWDINMASKNCYYSVGYPVHYMEKSSAYNLLCTACSGKMLHFWDERVGLVKKIDTSNCISNMAFNEQGSVLCVTMYNKQPSLYDIRMV